MYIMKGYFLLPILFGEALEILVVIKAVIFIIIHCIVRNCKFNSFWTRFIILKL